MLLLFLLAVSHRADLDLHKPLQGQPLNHSAECLLHILSSAGQPLEVQQTPRHASVELSFSIALAFLLCSQDGQEELAPSFGWRFGRTGLHLYSPQGSGQGFGRYHWGCHDMFFI